MHMAGYNDLFRVRIPELPSFDTWGIANKDAFSRMGLKSMVLLFANQDIGSTSKHLEMIKI